jgi:hypothetical protein
MYEARNRPEPPLLKRERWIAPAVWIGMSLSVLLIYRALTDWGAPEWVAIAVLGPGFAIWMLAWSTLVHNVVMPTQSTVWARRILLAIAFSAGALAAVSLLHAVL